MVAGTLAADEAGGGDPDRGKPLGRPRSAAPPTTLKGAFFLLETSVYVCSFISPLSASRVKTLTPVGGGGVLDAVTFLKSSP